MQTAAPISTVLIRRSDARPRSLSRVAEGCVASPEGEGRPRRIVRHWRGDCTGSNVTVRDPTSNTGVPHVNQHQPDEGNLSRLRELHDYRVADDDPDPRGWSVRTTAGNHIGEVEDLVVDTSRMKVEYFDLRLTDTSLVGADTVVVPADAVQLDPSGREAVLRDVDALRNQGVATSSITAERVQSSTGVAGAAPRDTENTQRLTRAEEELRIGKREVERGEVVVNKSVETEQVSTPVQRRVERVRVERRPVEGAAGAAPTITEGEIRVPIVEEEVIVEKRPVVKEEIVVSREVTTETENVTADLRKERVHVEGEELTREPAREGERGGRG
jgi:uncharacterized protein (TIGR02271 family)